MEKKRLVKLESVNAGYGEEPVLIDVDFEIYKQDFIGIIGPNGGGKTTLLKVILGILKPYSGTVEYNLSRKIKSIGYLPQFNQVDEQFPITVLDVVLSGLMLKNRVITRYTKRDKKKAESMLERMGILDLKNKTIGELSGGQMQRVFLSRAIISKPEMLILDEPNTYVDNKFEGELYEILRELNDEMAILLVTHDLGTITSYVKTIACVNRELHYHRSNVITEKQLSAYNCPIQLITHGEVPHTVLKKHNKE
jgi:zinc transport system ATP-binding protein